MAITPGYRADGGNLRFQLRHLLMAVAEGNTGIAAIPEPVMPVG